jgi:hypothetical protein
MTTQDPLFAAERGRFDLIAANGVSWAAIIAGSIGAAAVFLILLALGTGLGLSSISAWPNTGVSSVTFSLGAAFWMILVHAVASGGGGYLAGRLRVRWLGVDADEVYFRDTAHGFLAWALCAVLSASVLAAAAALVTTAGITTGGLVTAAAVSNNQAATSRDPLTYAVDTMFRSDRPSTDAAGDQRMRAEVGTIVANSFGARGELSAADRTYVARLVAARTGLSQADAERRVDEVMTQTRAAADAARKAAVALSLWSFIALLVGAFCASFAATCGGRHRDNVPSVALADTTTLRRV